ncbi:MAG: DUF1015 domain-containing protein [Eubacteriales bacterium]
MNKNCFRPADILLPKEADMSKWAVIACDQFTSQPEYWERVANYVGDAPSTLNLMLPEAILGTDQEVAHIKKINQTMVDYLEGGVFTTYENSLVYIERTLENGSIRKGLVGQIVLDEYNFDQGSTSQIRATEHTDTSRVVPRVRVRKNASLELPHVMVLLDDHEKMVIEPIAAVKNQLTKLYDFDLMENGGHITGWLVDGDHVAAFNDRLESYSKTVGEKYADLDGVPMVFAMGDGNHSLATAKAYFEDMKKANPGVDLSDHPAAQALVEIGNIHDEAQEFEPIHRVIFDCDVPKLLADLKASVCAETGYPLRWFIGEESGELFLDERLSPLAMGVFQPYLDKYLAENQGELDYIHGDQACADLAKQDNAIGFLLPSMEKSQLFRGVIADGVLPRKTFSMGHAHEKRYYLECHKITK